MADPRGRGFNRGKGRWHAPARKTITHPANYGFEFRYIEPDVDQPVYEFGESGIFLMYNYDPANGSAWMLGDGKEWAIRGTLDEVAAIAAADFAANELPIPFNGEPLPMNACVGPDDNGLSRGVDY